MKKKVKYYCQSYVEDAISRAFWDGVKQGGVDYAGEGFLAEHYLPEHFILVDEMIDSPKEPS